MPNPLNAALQDDLHSIIGEFAGEAAIEGGEVVRGHVEFREVAEAANGETVYRRQPVLYTDEQIESTAIILYDEGRWKIAATEKENGLYKYLLTKDD